LCWTRIVSGSRRSSSAHASYGDQVTRRCFRR
jgi:hypothetical protein